MLSACGYVVFMPYGFKYINYVTNLLENMLEINAFTKIFNASLSFLVFIKNISIKNLLLTMLLLICKQYDYCYYLHFFKFCYGKYLGIYNL